VALWIMLERTTLGRRILTIGGNPEAAKLMGVPVNQTLAITYIISGGCAGLAGVVLASGFGAGQPLEGWDGSCRRLHPWWWAALC